MHKTWARPAAALFGVGFGANQFSPLMVLYREQGHYPATAVAAFFGVYVLGLAPGLLLGGPASDRWGRRRVLLPASALAVPASAVLAFGVYSETLLYAGRLLFGVSMGVAMAVATTWVKELSTGAAGARRATLALTLGFGVGPLVAGVLAQFAPWPMELPYAVHVLIMLPVLWGLLHAPETVLPSPSRSLWRDLRVPAAAHPRFRRLVVPAAPWVFGAAALSYAVQPTLLAPSVGEYGLLVATGITVVSLAVGFAAQSVARLIDRRSEHATARIGVGLTIAGTLTAALVAATASVPVAVVAAVLLGAGYGFVLLSGLQEVQRIAAPEQLAGLTAVYYSLTYLGFLLPVVLAALTPFAGYPALLVAVAAVQAACLALVWSGAHRREPGEVRHREAIRPSVTAGLPDS